jgi:hypothetical protein
MKFTKESVGIITFIEVGKIIVREPNELSVSQTFFHLADH